MSYVVTFKEIVLSPRYDGTPWTQVQVFELGSLETNTPVSIGTFALTPLDTDPTNPAPHVITVQTATVPDQWYQFKASDAAGNLELSDPFFFDPNVPAWTATRYDVGALLRARTKDTAGNEIGTFNSNTRPTGEEVDRLLVQARNLVLTVTGTTPPAILQDVIRQAITLRTACLIELTYWPEQVSRGASPYAQLKELFDEEFKALRTAVEEIGDGDEFGAQDDAAIAVSTFPADAGGMVGWGTRW